MAQILFDERFIQEQAKALRRALADAYGRGDMPCAMECSRKLDALQLFLWKARAQRCA